MELREEGIVCGISNKNSLFPVLFYGTRPFTELFVYNVCLTLCYCTLICVEYRPYNSAPFMMSLTVIDNSHCVCPVFWYSNRKFYSVHLYSWTLSMSIVHFTSAEFVAYFPDCRFCLCYLFSAILS
jgi:hypothetical protein